jgi:hypothetical protein
MELKSDQENVCNETKLVAIQQNVIPELQVIEQIDSSTAGPVN